MHLRHSRSSLQRIHYRDLWQTSLSPRLKISQKRSWKKKIETVHGIKSTNAHKIEKQAFQEAPHKTIFTFKVLKVRVCTCVTRRRPPPLHAQARARRRQAAIDAFHAASTAIPRLLLELARDSCSACVLRCSAGETSPHER